MKKILKFNICIFMIFSIVMYGSTSLAANLNKQIKVAINPVKIIVNGKPATIDNFEYSGRIYAQAQDLSYLLNTEYLYNSKTKVVTISPKSPVKRIIPAKRIFSSIKEGTQKTLKVINNFVNIKKNGKTVFVENYNLDGVIFISVEEFTNLLNKDYLLDTKARKITLTEKKPEAPLFTQNTTKRTEGDVLVTISNWSNSSIKEYKIDKGLWVKYTEPILITSNVTIYARGTNIAGITSETVSFKVNNIHKLLSKVEVSQFNASVVKVISYNKNNIEYATGSGFYISDDGNVVTNYHVIDKASYIEVENSNKVKFKVSGVLSYSVEKDLAILKLDSSNVVAPINLGDSDKIALGDDVVTIGYPLGLQITVAFGNVSSISPDIKRKGYNNIQISAPISHGSSGGALFNMYGEVIGVIYATVEAGQNLNYAIPINDLKPMLEMKQLKTLSEVRDEVYVNMTYENFSDYLYYDYFEYNLGEYKLSLNSIYTYETKNEPNSLNVILYQYPNDYSVIEKAEANKDKSIIEKWIKVIKDEVKSKYPSKNITVGLCHAEYSTTYPNAQDPNMLAYDKDVGEWAIFKYKIIYYYEMGDYKFYWE